MENEKAIDKRLEIERQQEKFLRMFDNDIKCELETITVTIKRLRVRAKDYYGYDFQEELQDYLSDMI